jgi:hypothetical protein
MFQGHHDPCHRPATLATAACRRPPRPRPPPATPRSTPARPTRKPASTRARPRARSPARDPPPAREAAERHQPRRRQGQGRRRGHPGAPRSLHHMQNHASRASTARSTTASARQAALNRGVVRPAGSSPCDAARGALVQRVARRAGHLGRQRHSLLQRQRGCSSASTWSADRDSTRRPRPIEAHAAPARTRRAAVGVGGQPGRQGSAGRQRDDGLELLGQLARHTVTQRCGRRPPPGSASQRRDAVRCLEQHLRRGASSAATACSASHASAALAGRKPWKRSPAAPASPATLSAASGTAGARGWAPPGGRAAPLPPAARRGR